MGARIENVDSHLAFRPAVAQRPRRRSVGDASLNTEGFLFMCHSDTGASFERPGEDPVGCACDDASSLEQKFKGFEGLGTAESRCHLPISDHSNASGSSAARRVVETTPVPFVVQHARDLYFLTWETGRWTLAELEFDADSCTFVEQRRTHYDWPREAFGVLLSRFTLLERIETSLLQRTSDDFARWLAAQFQVVSKSA
ncbi:MAG: hypothetical protein WKF81_04120 [Thermomicrobiales bacterium]